MVLAVDTARGRWTQAVPGGGPGRVVRVNRTGPDATLELQPASHHLLLHCHAARGQVVVANSGTQGGLTLYRSN